MPEPPPVTTASLSAKSCMVPPPIAAGALPTTRGRAAPVRCARHFPGLLAERRLPRYARRLDRLKKRGHAEAADGALGDRAVGSLPRLGRAHHPREQPHEADRARGTQRMASHQSTAVGTELVARKT